MECRISSKSEKCSQRSNFARFVEGESFDRENVEDAEGDEPSDPNVIRESRKKEEVNL